MKDDRCTLCGATNETALWWHVHRDKRGWQAAVYCGRCTNRHLCPCYVSPVEPEQLELPKQLELWEQPKQLELPK